MITVGQTVRLVRDVKIRVGTHEYRRGEVGEVLKANGAMVYVNTDGRDVWLKASDVEVICACCGAVLECFTMCDDCVVTHAHALYPELAHLILGRASWAADNV